MDGRVRYPACRSGHTGFSILAAVVFAMHAIVFSSFVNAADAYPWNDTPLAEASGLPSWSNALERHTRQRSKISACLAHEKSCTGRYRAIAHILERARELTQEGRIKLAHRYINRLRYNIDRPRRVWNEATDKKTVYRNRWATLDEFLTHGGDCEDYAVAKYFLLREMGMSADRLRVVITFERRGRNHHALLAVRMPAEGSGKAEDVWLLESDNSIDRIPHEGYRFVYALNEHHVWDHAEPLDT